MRTNESKEGGRQGGRQVDNVRGWQRGREERVRQGGEIYKRKRIFSIRRGRLKQKD